MKDRWKVLAAAVPVAAVSLALLGAQLSDTAAANGLRLVADLSARELHVYQGGSRTDSYPISVGKPGHETPTGEFSIHKIDWNPDWTPPDSEWAEGRTPKDPGEAGNPMGRVRMIYKPPYSIHGTDDLDSLGQAESHGSIRMANSDIIELARRVMAAGGEDRSSEWYERVHEDRTTMYEVELPDPVPLENR